MMTKMGLGLGLGCGWEEKVLSNFCPSHSLYTITWSNYWREKNTRVDRRGGTRLFQKSMFFLSSYKENIFLLEELFISKIRMIDMGIFHIKREFCGIIEAETMQIIQKS